MTSRGHVFQFNGQGTHFLSIAIVAELSLLAVQFIIGMWMNIFAVYPSYNNAFPMYGMMDIMFSIPELMVHMMIGVLIGLLSLMIFMMTLMLGDYKSMVVSAIASISILLAGLSGLEFIFSNFQNNTFSFTMSIGFIIAVISFVFLLYSISIESKAAHLHS